MKNYKLYFSILVMTICAIALGCSAEQKDDPIGVVSLKFNNPDFGVGRELDSIILVDVIIESMSPLRVISDEVMVVSAVDENGAVIEGLVLTDNMTGREVVRAGYLFNNATQCWVWGRWITDTDTGQVDFQFGSASEQAYHNICAPQGSYYAKYTQNE